MPATFATISPGRRHVPTRLAIALTCVASALISQHAAAGTGKLRLTGGVSSVEGAAGGGISPWALIGGQGAADEVGLSVHASRAVTNDYRLSAYGVAVGILDRVELSLAHQDLDTGITGRSLGLPGLRLRQSIVGVKVRVAGEAILDSDRWMPQVAVGLQVKQLGSTGLDATLQALGAKRQGMDLYVSASKLLLAQGILVNGTLRLTKANQNGLLGFGATLGGANDRHILQPEVSVAYLLRPELAVGFEYRAMPAKLERAGRAAGLGNGLRADDWKDIFVAWAPTRNLSLTAAYVDLGRVVPATTNERKQTGLYLSAQAAF